MKNIILVVLVSTLTSACASIVSKSNYDVVINSTPGNATFVVTGKRGDVIFNGTTPGTVSLPASAGYFKSETYTIVVDKAGYAPYTYTLTSSVDGWYWGNLLIGGLIGMLVVDPATGAMYKLPPTVDVELKLVDDAQAAQSLDVTLLDKISDVQRSRLEKIQ